MTCRLAVPSTAASYLLRRSRVVSASATCILHRVRPLHTSSNNPPPPTKDWTTLNAYDPSVVEQGWYDWWRAIGVFRPRPIDTTTKRSKPFEVLWPPANVTGSLHIGHALTASIQDALVRWRRMSGDAVSWIPGSDHAGIATQTVVERRLYQATKQTRHDLGREALLSEIWQWCSTYGGKINGQLRQLGASLDWDREYFTLDGPRSQFVTDTFIRLFREGLVYRDTRMVNWCCHLRTVLSDVEVDTVELQGRTLMELPGRSAPVELGVLHRFAYPVADSPVNERIIVATTRLETMLGDAAVAVHPEDTRFKHLHGGAFVVHPFSGKRLPIVLDATLVDPAMGTGAVKVTPAHDFNDYECAQRHGLPIEPLIRPDGTLTVAAGPSYSGLDRYEARERVKADLKALGLYDGASDHPMTVNVCSRSKDVLEPMLLPQWYVKMDTMSARASEAVRSGALKIVPADHAHEWHRWLVVNCRDWCISRQLWWGHRVPAYCATSLPPSVVSFLESQPPLSSSFVLLNNASEVWVVAGSLGEAQQELRDLLLPCGPDLIETVLSTLKQDDDVLDTWFSSGLLPLSTLLPSPPIDSASNTTVIQQAASDAAPQRRHNDSISQQLDVATVTGPPLALMETGADILFFWVARMVMLTQHLTGGTLPFAQVNLHPIVRDAQGRKMSKSLGNVVDPIDVIHGVTRAALEDQLRAAALSPPELRRGLTNIAEQFAAGIPACGADALRMALLCYPQQTHSINLDMERVTTARLFCNKLWNTTKFVKAHVDTALAKDSTTVLGQCNPPTPLSTQLTTYDRWILSRLAATAEAVDTGMSSFQLNVAAQAVHDFLLHNLCDVYIEALKASRSKGHLHHHHGGPSASSAQVLLFAFEQGVRMLHPFMPFVTEEVWQRLRVVTRAKVADLNDEAPSAESIALAEFPSPADLAVYRSPQADADVATLSGIVRAARSLRQQYGISVGKAIPVIVAAADEARNTTIAANAPVLEGLARLASIDLVGDTQSSKFKACAVVVLEDGGVLVGMPLQDTIDVAKHTVRVGALVVTARSQVEGLEKRMALPTYADKAPPFVRDRDQVTLTKTKLQLDELERELVVLERINQLKNHQK